MASTKLLGFLKLSFDGMMKLTVKYGCISVVSLAGLDMEVVLEVFGEYFLEYCLKHGYDKMLVTLGGNFETFIQNLDSLHALLQLSYKNIQAPSFR